MKLVNTFLIKIFIYKYLSPASSEIRMRRSLWKSAVRDECSLRISRETENHHSRL